MVLGPRQIPRGLCVWRGLFQRVFADLGSRQVWTLGSCPLLCQQLVKCLPPPFHLLSLVNRLDITHELPGARFLPHWVQHATVLIQVTSVDFLKGSAVGPRSLGARLVVFRLPSSGSLQ